MIPRKIENYLKYIDYQDALWNAYTRAREATDNPEIQATLNDTYSKLMRHLEAAYYKKLCGRGLLSEDELSALKNTTAK